MPLHPALLFAVSSLLSLAPAGEPGTRIHLECVVHDPGGKPVAGARVHVYQTDASGSYTPDRPMDEPNARLSGWVTTDAEGLFVVDTIRPGGYPKAVRLEGVDRHIPAHVHMDVSAKGHSERRVQVVFADDPGFDDPYWKKWAASLRQPIVSLEEKDGKVTARVVLQLE